MLVLPREADGEGRVVVTGVLYIRPIDLVPQVLSMRAVNSSGLRAHASVISRFGQFFLERMLDEYLPLPLPRPLRKRLTQTTAK